MIYSRMQYYGTIQYLLYQVVIATHYVLKMVEQEQRKKRIAQVLSVGFANFLVHSLKSVLLYPIFDWNAYVDTYGQQYYLNLKRKKTYRNSSRKLWQMGHSVQLCTW